MNRKTFCRSIPALLAVLLACTGCALTTLNPAAPLPTPPTSAALADTTIVAIQPAAPPPPNLLDFTGVTHVLQSVGGFAGGSIRRLQNILGSRFPGLEATPPILAITDPANLSEDASPAVQVAAEVKAEEDAAKQKIKGIRYLASLGCGGCYPNVEEALLAALDDCTEDVRYEAVKGIRGTVGNACTFCKADACCSAAVRKKLRSIAYDLDRDGCFEEPSERVRRLARLALNGCGGERFIPEEIPDEGPVEGPSEASEEAISKDDDTATVQTTGAGPATALPSGVPVRLASDRQPTTIDRFGLAASSLTPTELAGPTPYDVAATNQSHQQMTPETSFQRSWQALIAGDQSVLGGPTNRHPGDRVDAKESVGTPVASVDSFSSTHHAFAAGESPSRMVASKSPQVSSPVTPLRRVSWEEFMIDPRRFDSVDRARDVLRYLQAKSRGIQAEKPPFDVVEITVRQFELTELADLTWDEKRLALQRLPVGQTSPVLVRNHRWYLLRVLAREAPDAKEEILPQLPARQ